MPENPYKSPEAEGKATTASLPAGSTRSIVINAVVCGALFVLISRLIDGGALTLRDRAIGFAIAVVSSLIASVVVVIRRRATN